MIGIAFKYPLSVLPISIAVSQSTDSLNINLASNLTFHIPKPSNYLSTKFICFSFFANANSNPKAIERNAEAKTLYSDGNKNTIVCTGIQNNKACFYPAKFYKRMPINLIN